MMPAMKLWPGKPFPLGATWNGLGVNFALYSEYAEAVELLLFDHPEDKERRGEEYYYQYVRKSRQRALSRDAIPTDEFVFRSYRNSYWMTECFANLALLNDTRCGRRFLDAMSREQLERSGFTDPGLSVEERERCLVLQDIGINLHRLEEGIEYDARSDDMNVFLSDVSETPGDTYASFSHPGFGTAADAEATALRVLHSHGWVHRNITARTVLVSITDRGAGIPVDAPHRNYRDPWPKPELLCALSPFEALCGFRRVAATVALLDALDVDRMAPFARQLEREGEGALGPVREGVDGSGEWTHGDGCAV
jgi:hypothetical protein